MIDSQLHSKTENGWELVDFEYYTIDNVTKDIIKQLKSIAAKKVRFYVEKDIETNDLVSDFLIQIAEGYLPLRKTKGVPFDKVIFSRFLRNYLKDYFKKNKIHFVQIPFDLEIEESEEFDDIGTVLKFYNLCKNNEERLIILSELWRNYQERHSNLENKFVNNISEHAKLVLDLFEMPKYFTTYMLNYSQCQLALGSPNSDDYRAMKQKLYKELKKYATIT
jgi:hypothetical protein